jgi:hypothetical protein
MTVTEPTHETIENSQIRALMAEAKSAGDRRMVDTCNAALAGSMPAREICAAAIRDARAQED